MNVTFGRKTKKLAVLGGGVIAVFSLALLGTVAALGAWWSPELDPLKLPEDLEALYTGNLETPTPPKDFSFAGEFVEDLMEAATTPREGLEIFEEVRAVRRVPMMSNCATPEPMLARSVVAYGDVGPATISIEVHGAGLGQRILDAQKSATGACGAVLVPGIEHQSRGWRAVRGNITEERWRYGDVIVAVASYGGAGFPGELENLVADLKDTSLKIGRKKCRKPSEKESGATRNPTQSDYVPYKESVRIELPEGYQVPERRLNRADIPTGPIPPIGSVTEKPKPPESPRLPSGRVKLPAFDRKGPGCGWDFTGMVSPKVNQKDISEVRKRDYEQARIDLLDAYENWPSTVAKWRQDYSQYKAALESFEAWEKEDRRRQREERQRELRES